MGAGPSGQCNAACSPGGAGGVLAAASPPASKWRAAAAAALAARMPSESGKPLSQSPRARNAAAAAVGIGQAGTRRASFASPPAAVSAPGAAPGEVAASATTPAEPPTPRLPLLGSPREQHAVAAPVGAEPPLD